MDDQWAGSDAEQRALAADTSAGSRERRKSLPSIVKMPVAPVAPMKQQQTGASNTTTGTVPLRRQQVDTYVIENGVRKRVR